MTEKIVRWILDYSSVPVYLVVLYATLIYKKLPRELKTFSWFLFLTGMIQLLSSWFYYQKQNNMPILHFYVVAGSISLTAFYQDLFKGFIKPNVLWTLTAIFVILSLCNSIWIQDIYTFNSYALTLQSVLIIVMSLTSFRILMNDIVREKRMSLIKSFNWINSGLFIYYTSSLLVFYFGNVITLFSQSPLIKYTWTLHALFSSAMYICFFIGLWKRPRN